MAQAHHRVPLWGLFLALLALTAAEVALYEVWSRNQGIMPKYVMVLILIFVLTLPKAMIVLTYFMHLKFERQLIVALALIPFAMVFVAVLPILTDTVTLKPDAYNQVEGLRDFGPPAGHGHTDSANTHGDAPHDEVTTDDGY